MAWYNSSWSYRVKVTALAAKVDADLADFPVYVDLNDLPAGFHTNVNQTDARDIRVTTSDGETEVPREVVFYDAATDTGELHFKGDVDSDTDTDFYIYYGNAGASDYAVDDAYGRNNVWTANYDAVWHLNESAGNAVDSTGLGITGTFVGSLPDPRTDAALGNSQHFDGTGDWITCGTSPSRTSNFSVSAWVKPDSLATDRQIISKGYNGTNTQWE